MDRGILLGCTDYCLYRPRLPRFHFNQQSAMQEKHFKYEGKDVTVDYDLKRCIHAAECVEGLPAVFDPNKKPWIQPDNAAAGEVAAVIRTCPSGALKYNLADGPDEAPAAANTITIDPDGPLYARGDLEIKTPEGETLLKDVRIALCRCGKSKNKPLCDLSHSDAGFVDPGNLGDSRLSPDESAPGRLTFITMNNGPLRFEGKVTIHSADGKSTVEGVKGAFCRCGASKNKPFCDGSHRDINFEA